MDGDNGLENRPGHQATVVAHCPHCSTDLGACQVIVLDERRALAFILDLSNPNCDGSYFDLADMELNSGMKRVNFESLCLLPQPQRPESWSLVWW